MGHPGNPAYRAIEPIAAQGRGVLLLTATPLEDDALGFLRLAELLHPDAFGAEERLLERLEDRTPLPPCTSATRAVDIGGWPPRTPQPVAIEERQWRPFERLELAMRQREAETPVAKTAKARLVFEATAAPSIAPKLLKEANPEIEALATDAALNDPRLAYLIEHAPEWRKQGARTRVQEAAFHQLHRDPYRQSMAEDILGRVPSDLESLTKEIVLEAAAAFGFEVEQQRGKERWFIALGGEALVESLPGVPDESRFLGTFSREEAVANESLYFFSSGHPLVEGVLEELREGNRGRTACFEAAGDEELLGLLALFKRDGDIEAVAVDARGRRRPDLAAALTAPGCALKPAAGRRWASLPGWGDAVRRMAVALPDHGVPQALAAFRMNPDDSKGGRRGDR